MPSFLDLTLQTARLRLRAPLPADADVLFAMRSDPVVQRYGSHVPWTDRQLAIDWLDLNIREMSEGTVAQLFIERREDSAVVGTCTLYGIDAQCRRAEVGYALNVADWGHGYANEAVTALLGWGFEHLALNRIEADVDPRNAPSIRAMERLGFTREGHLRERWIVGGEVGDSLIYGLLAAEWKAAR